MQHRAPLPEPLLHAMISLGLAWCWEKWVAALTLCFYAGCRIGGILKARRKDLLTPRDLMIDQQTVYLNVVSPKSRRRGAKVRISAHSAESLGGAGR